MNIIMFIFTISISAFSILLMMLLMNLMNKQQRQIDLLMDHASSVGDIVIRKYHSRIKEIHNGKGGHLEVIKGGKDEKDGND